MIGDAEIPAGEELVTVVVVLSSGQLKVGLTVRLTHPTMRTLHGIT